MLILNSVDSLLFLARLFNPRVHLMLGLLEESFIAQFLTK